MSSQMFLLMRTFHVLYVLNGYQLQRYSCLWNKGAQNYVSIGTKARG